MTRVPLVDLRLQHHQIEAEVRCGMESVFADSSYVLGPAVAEFEEAFAGFCGVEHCVGVGSGTDALELLLRGLEIGPGDEVVLPANTFIATALAVVRAGATPVLVDAEAETHLIDVEKVRAALGARTRAVIPVHLYGQVAEMEALEQLCQGASVALLEDAAQAHGARRRGRVAGSLGRGAAFSFYPAKNLGAYGDGGAVVTEDAHLARRLRRLRNWGSDEKYHHPEQGFNSRLDTLQAVVLLAKLRRLPDWNEQRRQAAQRYHRLLAELPGVELPKTHDANEHVWHLYVVRVRDRARIHAALLDAGIDAGIHYPVPIHLQGAFSQLGLGPGSFPVTERAASEILSLPLYPGISSEQQGRVVAALRAALS